MRILVTGGAGFIGRRLVSSLLERGDEVVVVDSLEEQVHDRQDQSFPGDVRFLHGSVGDQTLVDQALEGVERVVHLAAVVGPAQSMYEIARYVERNTTSTSRFLECLVARRSQIDRVVVASSMAIYGEGAAECPSHGAARVTPREDAQLASRRWELECPTCRDTLRPVGTSEGKALEPTTIYAISKRDQEEMCLVVGKAYSISTIALRFFNVYGPGQAMSNPYTGVPAIFSTRLLNGKPPLIFEDGLQSRDFIHVSDVVRGILLALEPTAASGMAINIGTGRPVTVNEISSTLQRGLGLQIEPLRPNQYRAGDVRHCFADVSLAAELLGFRSIVSFEDGMGELVGWLANASGTDHVDHAAAELARHGLTR